MTLEEGYSALDAAAVLRPPVREAVLAYWRDKRIRRGKPLLRRLQAPTSASDTNPFNVFRCAAHPVRDAFHHGGFAKLMITGQAIIGTVWILGMLQAVVPAHAMSVTTLRAWLAHCHAALKLVSFQDVLVQMTGPRG